MAQRTQPPRIEIEIPVDRLCALCDAPTPHCYRLPEQAWECCRCGIWTLAWRPTPELGLSVLLNEREIEEEL